jgi:serine/threonine protein kinase
VLAALQAAHKQHILHLDVKPANILLAADRVVLTDFGIAMVDGTAPLSADPLIGSPSYIAPERARGQEPGPPADLWGLGATLYAAVEGRSPFDRNGDPRASLAAAVRDEPEAVVRGGLLSPVISGLLRKNPATRLTAAEVEPLLRQVVPRPGSRRGPRGGPHYKGPPHLGGMRPASRAARGWPAGRPRGGCRQPLPVGRWRPLCRGRLRASRAGPPGPQ